MDRGADYGQLLLRLIKRGVLLTVRATHNRVMYRRGRKQKLFSTLARQPVVTTVRIDVPRGHRRIARRATFEIRTLRSATVRMQKRPQVCATVGAVRVREISSVPADEAPIEWTVLTTAPLNTASDAVRVVQSYTRRWTIEEFHKTWKSGHCNIERSQLRSYEAIQRWATILAAVAARVERLKRLSREDPERDALTELSRDELDAVILLSRPRRHDVGADLALHDAVTLIATIGGYLGRKRDGPPGSITIGRGLDRIAPAALVLRAQRSG